MFLSHYDILGSPVSCTKVQKAGAFSLEKDIYAYLKRRLKHSGWRLIRIETSDKIGFPDLLLVKGTQYIFAELKYSRVKVLKQPEKQLTWQFGQLSFMKKCLMYNNPYCLVIADQDELAFLTGEQNENTADHAHVVEFIRLCC